MLRTHTCGQLRASDEGMDVHLCGWVHVRRDHGGVVFIDLRDRYGITQVTFNPLTAQHAWDVVNTARPEYVLLVKGKVVLRPEDMVNKKIATGEVEIEAQEVTVLNTSKTPPFEVAEGDGKEISVNEEVRMEYRYIDMRRKRVLKNFILRHKIIAFIRRYLDGVNFLEVETPILTKSTPEGARDYLVPSRLHLGQFYALPQSPQQYKQLLMIGGIDRYFQIARCFRDEDQRGERQPEFTQLDIEMSFIEQEDILALIEDLFTKLVEEFAPHKKIKCKPWQRLTYDTAMLKYGVDKPDLRFDLEIVDISENVRECGFQVFADAIKQGGVVRAINAKGAGSFARSEIDELTEFVKKFGAHGLAYIIVREEGQLHSPIIKFLGAQCAEEIVKTMNAETGDTIFFGAGNKFIVQESLGNLRGELAKRLNLIDNNELAFAFVVDFPLFEEEKKGEFFAPSHHMFTAPKTQDIPLLDTAPQNAKCLQHDVVLNGHEVAGGSIRIHDSELQSTIFKLIGFSKEQEQYFAHMIKAFTYGAPPHGGIASGLDRLIMILADEENIREVMYFPKNQKAQDVLMGAPAGVAKSQLDELGIRVVESL